MSCFYSRSSAGFLDRILDLELHKVACTSQSSQDNLGVFMYIYLFLSGLFSQQMEIDLNFNSRKMYFLDFVWGRFGKLMEDILDIFVLLSAVFWQNKSQVGCTYHNQITK